MRQAFDGGDLAVDLNGKHQAGAHGRAIDDNGARAANAVLAADMGTGELEVMTQAIGQRGARLDFRCVRLAIYFQLYSYAVVLSSSATGSPAARASARSVRTPSKARRYSPGAWISSAGCTLLAAPAPASRTSAAVTALPSMAASTASSRSGVSPIPMAPTWTFAARPS